MGQPVAAPLGVSNASRTALNACFAQVGQHLPNGRWLDVNNRYATDCINRINFDLAQPTGVDQASLSQYIAASAPLHCLDGWGYLGRALGAHTVGDSDVARHQAYYAELRAALSLLASEGIGLFDRTHFLVTGPATVQKLQSSSGTHRITWSALEEWAGQPAASTLLGQVITHGGYPLSDWLQAFLGANNLGAIAQEWFRAWGVDLQKLGNDRDARNEGSYRPTRVVAKPVLDVMEASSFVRELWSLWEPTAPSQFDNLDQHLVRRCIDLTYQAVSGNRPQDDRPDFEARVATMLRRLGLGATTAARMQDFFTRRDEPADHPVLLRADVVGPVTDPAHHVQVMGRACLLLRLATGSAAKLLADNYVGSSDLGFWWKALVEDRGFWDVSQPMGDLTDLWLDMEDAVKAVASWESGVHGQATYSVWRQSLPHELLALGECERAALWGMGL